MSGYCNFSKSNNAVFAERAGKYPATEAGRRLGLPAKFLKDECAWATGGEWHHTSKYFNLVDYFETAEIQAWMNGDADAAEEHGDFAAALAAWTAAQKAAQAAPVKIYAEVTVKWLEWSGTRNHPHATECVERNATVEDGGGKFVTVRLAGGRIFKKGRDTNGFEVADAAGKRIWL